MNHEIMQLCYKLTRDHSKLLLCFVCLSEHVQGKYVLGMPECHAAVPDNTR